MKYALLVIFCIFSFMCCFSTASALYLAVALISLIAWLIISRKDVAQLLAFRAACIVMLVIIGVPILGNMMDNTKYVDDVNIAFFIFFAVSLIVSSIRIRRIRYSRG